MSTTITTTPAAAAAATTTTTTTCDNEEGTCMLIDVAISGDRNVIKKEAENILKYTDLTTEIQHMRNVKTKVITVIKGSTGTISKPFRKYLKNILECTKSRD